MEQLLSSDGWVVITFEDGTINTIHTTLNEDLLSRHGVSLKEDHFYDLDRGIFIPFRKDAKDISVYAEKPQFDSEVLRFADRFI